MKNYIKASLAGLLVVPAMLVAFGAAPVADAQFNRGLRDGANAAQGQDQEGNAACLFGGEDCPGEQGIFRTITNILLFIIGAIAVIMLVIGGIRYTTSNGDSNAVSAAKNTILYAVVGIVVAILAYAVVNFVIGGIANTST